MGLATSWHISLAYGRLCFRFRSLASDYYTDISGFCGLAPSLSYGSMAWHFDWVLCQNLSKNSLTLAWGKVYSFQKKSQAPISIRD